MPGHDYIHNTHCGLEPKRENRLWTPVILNSSAAVLAAKAGNWLGFPTISQLLTPKFPTHPNRDFYRANRELLSAEQGKPLANLQRMQFSERTGVATYKILSGLLRPKIPEGGVVRIEKSDNGVVLSHDVFMDFPESPWGKIMLWTFTKVFNGDQAVYDHTYRELLYFKAQLERPVQGKG